MDFASETSLADADAQIRGVGPNQAIGHHMGNVGDLNEDGFGDFAIQGYEATSDKYQSTFIWIFYGRPRS